MKKINCDFKGIRNGNVKLNDAQVAAIRSMWATEVYSLRKLGFLFKVSHSQIRRIVKGIQR
jgi:hypothetical protein